MKITATEINKFTYCPYQWYYEKAYGVKRINELAAQRCSSNDSNNNFERGKRFHNKYHKKLKIKNIFDYYTKVVGFIIFLTLVGIIYYMVVSYVS